MRCSGIDVLGRTVTFHKLNFAERNKFDDANIALVCMDENAIRRSTTELISALRAKKTCGAYGFLIDEQ